MEQSHHDIQSHIFSILRDRFEIDTTGLTNETDFVKDLGLDSLDVVELVMDMESGFNIEVPDTDMENMKTVGDALLIVRNALGNPMST